MRTTTTMPFDTLQNCLENLMKRFNVSLQDMYEPHISLAWRLGSETNSQKVLDTAQDSLAAEIAATHRHKLRFTELKLKIGSRIHSFPLKVSCRTK